MRTDAVDAEKCAGTLYWGAHDADVANFSSSCDLQGICHTPVNPIELVPLLWLGSPAVKKIAANCRSVRAGHISDPTH